MHDVRVTRKNRFGDQAERLIGITTGNRDRRQFGRGTQAKQLADFSHRGLKKLAGKFVVLIVESLSAHDGDPRTRAAS